MSVYQSCEIRGDAATELSADLYESWGRALGRQLPPAAKFIVGGDIRESTPRFLAALIEGLCQTGLDVVNLGLLPAPMIHYARQRLRADGCAIVTAAHAPAGVNGLRWRLGDRPPTPDDVAVLQQAAEKNLPSPTGIGAGGEGTEPRDLDISFDYVAGLQETFVDSMLAERFAVLDPMFGCWAERIRRYLHAIFPRCVFSTIHDSVDPQFHGRTPDCSHPRELDDLCEAVYRERAHLGIAFDGDGDGIALVDNEGVALRAEEAAWLLLQCLGEKLHGGRFVHDLKFSDRIPEAARRLDAEPLVERSGHAHFHRRMIDSDAMFGAESGGHYFYKALGGCDDGLYTACLVIAHLARSGKSLAELRRGCPAVAMTTDLFIPMPADVQPLVIEKIRAAWADFPQRTIDGLRIDMPGGWALVGSSATEPGLTFRFEALDWHALDDLVERFCQTLPEHGDQLRQRFAAAMGGVL